MELFLIFLSTIALIISKIALFRFLIYSFLIELKNQKINEKYVNREARKIKIPSRDESQIKIEFEQTALLRKTLFWTMSFGEVVGYIFVTLSQHHLKTTILAVNAIILLIGSLLCQILTMINAWIKRKTDLLFRIEFQLGLVLLGTIVIAITASNEDLLVNQLLLYIVLAYFFTVVAAIFSMLIDALFAKQGVHDFDYNNYSRLVILSGIIIGSGFFFIFL